MVSVIRHSFTIEDLVSAPNLKLGCAVILRGCASDYKYIQTVLVVYLVQVLDYLFGDRLDVVDRCEGSVPMFPGTDVPRTYVPRYRCSPVPMFPGFCTLIVVISINRLQVSINR